MRRLLRERYRSSARRPLGSARTWVSEPPKGTLILRSAFTAQPFASRIGPRLRWRSLSQAMSIDGPEIARSTPTTPSGIHMPRPKNVADTLAEERSRWRRRRGRWRRRCRCRTSSRGLRRRRGAGAAGAAALAPGPRRARLGGDAALSRWSSSPSCLLVGATRLLDLLLDAARHRLYGDQNACRMLMGCSMSSRSSRPSRCPSGRRRRRCGRPSGRRRRRP